MRQRRLQRQLRADNSPPDGFTALFNGQNLDGWHISDKGEEGVWTVEDGAIVHSGRRDGKTSHLFTDEKFENYRLLIDWKLDSKGTAGVYYGHQGVLHIKIWDAHNAKGPPASEGSGSLGYGKDRVRPQKIADHPRGEWNTFDITIEDGLVTVRLNGELIIDKAPKTFKKPPFPIGLQDHGTQVSFKNIYVKRLSAATE